MNKLLSVLFFVLSVGLSHSQNIGPHDSNIEWHEIENKWIKVIFPKDQRSEAKKILNVSETLGPVFSETRSKWKKTSIVLRTKQVISNGFVTLAPFHSSFFNTPPRNNQRFGNVDWLKLLSIHELQHVFQFNDARNGLTKFLYYLFGDYGWGLGMFSSTSPWYFEGEAVRFETQYTLNGRGRSPSFFNSHRALLDGQSIPSYYTMLNGSFKKMTFNEYNMGYIMSSYLNNLIEDKAINEIYRSATSFKGLYMPFNYNLNKSLGFDVKGLYSRSHKEKRQHFERLNMQKSFSEFTPLVNVNKKDIVQYQMLYRDLSSNGFYALKNSYDHIPHLVKIEKGSTSFLTEIGTQSEPYLNINQEWVVWPVISNQKRRTYVQFHDLVLFNLKNNKKKIIRNKKQYFSPFVNADGKIIGAVTKNSDQKLQIECFDPATNKILKTISCDNYDGISFPKWISETNTIYFVAKIDRQNVFVAYDYNKDRLREISPRFDHAIGNFTLNQNKIFFSASFESIDQIYSLEIKQPSNIKKLFSLPNSVYDPTFLSNGNLACNYFTKEGQIPILIDAQNFSSAPFELPPAPHIQKVYPVNSKAHKVIEIAENKTDSIAVKPYKSLADFRLYHWGISMTGLSSGLQIINLSGSNLLETLSLDANLIKNENEGNWFPLVEMVYGKPFVRTHLNLSKVQRSYFNYDTSENYNRFKDLRLGLGLSVPLQWQFLTWNKLIYLKGEFVKHMLTEQAVSESVLDSDFETFDISGRIALSKQKSFRQIFPNWGLDTQFNYKKSLNTNLKSEWFSSTNLLNIPGLWKNHHLLIGYRYQFQDQSNRFLFSDIFTYARGHEKIANDQVNLWSFDYHLPLFYPDFNLLGFHQTLRVRGNIFADFSQLTFDRAYGKIEQNSFGAAAIFDNRVFGNGRYSLGFRYSYRLANRFSHFDKPHHFSWFLSISP